MQSEKKKILIRGAGEMASGVAFVLHRFNFNICMTDISDPQAVRREVCFCEAVYEGEKTVENITGELVSSFDEIDLSWSKNRIPIIVDPDADTRKQLKPDILVDAILAKKNLGTTMNHAPLVIGLGPGFYAGRDVHLVIETNRGHNLGRVIRTGEAEKNTGVPGMIGGYSIERVLRAPKQGIITTIKEIGTMVKAGDVIAKVDDMPVLAQIDGVVRGLLKNGTVVWKGMKAGDIDPRGEKRYCYTVSDKARAIGNGVLEAILSNSK